MRSGKVRKGHLLPILIYREVSGEAQHRVQPGTHACAESRGQVNESCNCPKWASTSNAFEGILHSSEGFYIVVALSLNGDEELSVLGDSGTGDNRSLII